MSQNRVTYSWKQFECEICRTPYPYVFKANGTRFRLVDIDLPKTRNFLWLESLTFEKNSSRIVHIVMPSSEKTNFKMGRGQESDLRVNDISVSRCHAILKYSRHHYYLEDNTSKFGTLVLSDHPVELQVDKTQAIQIGRSVISFTVKQLLQTAETGNAFDIQKEFRDSIIGLSPPPKRTYVRDNSCGSNSI